METREEYSLISFDGSLIGTICDRTVNAAQVTAVKTAVVARKEWQGSREETDRTVNAAQVTAVKTAVVARKGWQGSREETEGKDGRVHRGR